MSFAKSFGQVLFVYLKIHIVIHAYYLVSINYSHLQKACCHCFQSLLFFSFYQPYQRNKRGLSVKVKSLQAQFINLKKSKCYFPVNGLFQKKKNKQEGTYFFEKPLEFLAFLLCPWKFQIEQGFTPTNSTKLLHPKIVLEDYKTKTLVLKFLMIFS